jgi:hypothetical protein
MTEHHFVNRRSDKFVIGEIVGRGIQPFSGVEILQIRVTEGPEKGTLYWVPAKDVKPDGALGVLAQI